MVGPQLPVSRSTKLGTLPAAILSWSGEPLMVVLSMNWAWVTTEAMVVNSLMTTRAGGLLPTTANRAMAGLLPPPCCARVRPRQPRDRGWNPPARSSRAHCKAAFVVGLGLRELLGRGGSCSPKCHRGLSDRRSSARHLAFYVGGESAELPGTCLKGQGQPSVNFTVVV